MYLTTPSYFRNNGDLNTELVWYLNSRKEFGC